MAMIEQAMKMFTPFAAATGANQPPQTPGSGTGTAAPQSPDAIREMQQQLDEMKRQLAQIAEPGTPPKRPG
jgi:polyhydroxyalkanoate synthesis regulator protein